MLMTVSEQEDEMLTTKKPSKRAIDADAIRQIRMDREITQQELANVADLSLGQISRIEGGRIASPHFRTVRKIAGALGVETDELYQSRESRDGES
jgi:transcriptional regulator with XRE-family HTH domain